MGGLGVVVVVQLYVFYMPELFELAGDLSHRLNHAEAAIDMYRRGGAYARAIELARNVSPEEVTVLEEEWGDWYVPGHCIYLCFSNQTAQVRQKLMQSLPDANKSAKTHNAAPTLALLSFRDTSTHKKKIHCHI